MTADADGTTEAFLRGLVPSDVEAADDDDLDVRQMQAVYELTGCLLTFANNLKRYWTVPGQPGYRKIRWGTPGDWRRCHRHLRTKVGSERAKRMCSAWHREVTGVYPGDRRNVGN